MTTTDSPDTASRWPDLSRVETVGALFQLVVYVVSLVFQGSIRNTLVVGAAALVTSVVVRLSTRKPWNWPSRVLVGAEVAAFGLLFVLAHTRGRRPGHHGPGPDGEEPGHR